MTRKTRRLLWLAVAALLLAGAYTGYWFWLARTFETNIALWVEQQRALGYRISYAAGKPYGYPLPLRIDARDIVVESPPYQSPWRLNLRSKVLSLAPWAPLSLRIDDDSGDSVSGMLLNANGREFHVSTEDLRVTIYLPTSSGPPDFKLVAQSISISENERLIAGVIQPSFRLDLFQPASQEERSAVFQFDAYGIDFPSGLQPGFGITETYSWWIEGQVKGAVPAAPLTAALGAWSSNGGTVEFERLEANWNTITDVSGNGTLALDAQLQPLFAGTANVQGYNEAIDALAQAGMLELGQVTGAKIALAAMSKPSEDGGPRTARLPITIQDGFLFIGPLKLAQMPRIVWQ
jgi:Uncharacterized protein conserved in bacteria (DUF2125)